MDSTDLVNYVIGQNQPPPAAPAPDDPGAARWDEFIAADPGAAQWDDFVDLPDPSEFGLTHEAVTGGGSTPGIAAQLAPAAGGAVQGAALPQASGAQPVATAPGLYSLPGGVSASTNGYSATKNQAIARGPQAQLQQRIAGNQQARQAEYAPFQQANEQVAGYETQAANAMAQAEQAKIDATARHNSALAQHYTDYKNAEEFAWASARAKAEDAKTNYQAALMDWAATTVNPGQLFQSAGKADQWGMGISAFVHDFLGAKGIKTSALDTLNTAIDRNINAQLAEINKKGQVAAGFKQLWDMQRAMSATDDEARARVRGFALTAAMKQLESEMGQYDSSLAGAKSQAAKVAIMKELIKNNYAVQKQIDDAANADATREIQTYGHTLQASLAAQRIAADKEIARITHPQQQLTGQDQAALAENLIVEQDAKGRPLEIRQFRNGIEAAAKTKMALAEGARRTMDGLVTEVIQLQKDHKAGVLTNTVFKSEVERRSQALAQAATQLYNLEISGMSSTDREYDRSLKLLAQDRWWERGDNIKQLHQFRLMTNRKVANNMDVMTVSVPKSHPAWQMTWPKSQFGAASRAESEAELAPDQPPSREEIAMRAFGRPDATDMASGDLLALTVKGDHTATDTWKDFVKANPSYMARYGASPPASFAATDILRQEVGPPTTDALTGEPKPDPSLVLLEAWAGLASGAIAAPDGTDANSQEAQDKHNFALFQYNLLKNAGK